MLGQAILCSHPPRQAMLLLCRREDVGPQKTTAQQEKEHVTLSLLALGELSLNIPSTSPEENQGDPT